MINLTYPLFKIPDGNRSNMNKPGWWTDPKFYWDPHQFQEFKRERIGELSSMINDLQRQEPNISDEILWDQVFFKVKFHEKALSKSTQPVEFLDKYNIDIYAQKGKQTFYASTTAMNLENFKNGISTITLKNTKESAYLSAITWIWFLSENDINIPKTTDKKLFIYLHDTITENNWRKYYEAIKKEYKIKDSEFFISNSKSKIIYWYFPQNFLDEISQRRTSPIQKIEQANDYNISNIESLNFDFNWIKVEEPLLNSTVVVVDSWIKEHGVLKWLIDSKFDTIWNSEEINNAHWTMVWSRVVFWNTILEQINKWIFTAESKVVDFRIMGNNGKIDGKLLVDNIKQFLDIHSREYKIYNLSFNAQTPINPNWKDFLTRELDALAHIYNVLFVVSAWNHAEYPQNNYPECLDSLNAKIAAPADWINVLSVGSVTNNYSSRTDAKDWDPSPFTRTWIDGIRKPELVHYWWNLDKNGLVNGIWVIWLWIEENKIIEQSWTSFSAPLVSQDAGKLYAYLRDSWFTSSTSELVKALLIHSATYDLPENSLINSDKINQYVWYWIPDFMRAINSISSSATFIYTGIMWWQEIIDDKWQKINKQKIIIDVPHEVEGKWKEVKVKWTLVYFPEISSSWEIDYALADLSINIHYKNWKGTTKSWWLKEWRDEYRVDWYPLKTFEKVYKAYKWWQWDILLQWLVRWHLDWATYKQPYALVITIEDISKWNKVPLHDIIKNQYKQYILLPQIIENKQRIELQS